MMKAIMTYENLAILFQMATFLMLARSLFHLIRVRKQIKPLDFWVLTAVLVVGIGLTTFNMSDTDYVIRRFPFNAIFATGSAWAFFLLTKSKKDDLFSIQNVIKQEYSTVEDYVMKKIRDDEPEVHDIEVVTASDLDELVIGKSYPTTKRIILVRLRPPVNKDFDYKFRVDMLAGGSFAEQRHPDLYEEIYVDTGAIVDKSTNTTYKAGEVLNIPKDAPHWIVALERTQISAYLYKSKPN